MIVLNYGDLEVKFDLVIYTSLVSLTGWTVKQGTPGYYSVRATKLPYKGKRISRIILPCSAHELVDHVNGDSLDNRLCNLRIVSHSQNQYNKAVSSSKRSGLPKGVYYNKRLDKFWAEIKCDGRRIYLGLFTSPEAAEQEYIKTAIKYHQQYARVK